MKAIHTPLLDDAHQEIALLLPWYVNNTLFGDELEQVTLHLSVCDGCKQEVINLNKLGVMITSSSLNIKYLALHFKAVNAIDNKFPGNGLG